MTKREFIKSKYGALWPVVEKHVDENGWVVTHNEEGERTGAPDFDEFPPLSGELSEDYGWRIVGLMGIEDNNGWSNVEEEGLPTERGLYHVIDYGVIRQRFFENGFSWKGITHWKRIPEPGPYLY